MEKAEVVPKRDLERCAGGIGGRDDREAIDDSTG